MVAKAAPLNGAYSVEHSSFPDDESIALYKKTGAIMVPTLSYITRWTDEYVASLVPYQKIRKQQFREQQPKGVAKAYKAGVIIAAGTDVGSGLMIHGLSVEEPIAFVDLAGMTPMDAIVTATVNGAKLLRKEASFGSRRRMFRAHPSVGCRFPRMTREWTRPHDWIFPTF